MIGKEEEPIDGRRLAGRLVGRREREEKREEAKKKEKGSMERSGSLRHDL